MNRRGFLGRISKALAGAVLGAHITLGELVPMIEPEPMVWVSYRFRYTVTYCWPTNMRLRVIDVPRDVPIDAYIEGV